MAAEYLGTGNNDGVILGRDNLDKVGFYGTTATAGQIALTTAPAATAATSSTPFGYSQTQADAVITWIRAVDAALKARGLIAAS